MSGVDEVKTQELAALAKLVLPRLNEAIKDQGGVVAMAALVTCILQLVASQSTSERKLMAIDMAYDGIKEHRDAMYGFAAAEVEAAIAESTGAVKH